MLVSLYIKNPGPVQPGRLYDSRIGDMALQNPREKVKAVQGENLLKIL